MSSFKTKQKIKDIALRSLSVYYWGRWSNHIDVSACCTPAELRILLSLGCKFKKNSHEERWAEYNKEHNRNRRANYSFHYVTDEIRNFAMQRTKIREKKQSIRVQKWKERLQESERRSKERAYVRSLR